MAPGVEYVLRVDRRCEDVGVQAFVAQPAAEAFDEGILHRFARTNEFEPDVVRIRPRVHRATDEFAAIVDGDRGRRAALVTGGVSAAATLMPVSDRSATSASASRV
jgi:hypothetical protein